MENLLNWINNFKVKIMSDIGKNLFEIAKEYSNDVIRQMTGTATDANTSYKRGKKGIHHPSLPGYPPARDSGALVRSIIVEKNTFGATVNVKAPYAGFLEYGTKKMAARPVWEDTLEHVKVINKITAEVEKNFK